MIILCHKLYMMLKRFDIIWVLRLLLYLLLVSVSICFRRGVLCNPSVKYRIFSKLGKVLFESSSQSHVSSGTMAWQKPDFVQKKTLQKKSLYWQCLDIPGWIGTTLSFQCFLHSRLKKKERKHHVNLSARVAGEPRASFQRRKKRVF